jgi:hypothetical protein
MKAAQDIVERIRITINIIFLILSSLETYQRRSVSSLHPDRNVPSSIVNPLPGLNPYNLLRKKGKGGRGDEEDTIYRRVY